MDRGDGMSVLNTSKWYTILDISHKGNHIIMVFCVWLLVLRQFSSSQGSSTFKHVSVLHCFLWGGLQVCIEHLLHFREHEFQTSPSAYLLRD